MSIWQCKRSENCLYQLCGEYSPFDNEIVTMKKWCYGDKSMDLIVNSVIQLVVLIEWLFVESNNPQSTLLTHHSILQYTLPIHHSLCECFTPLSFISTTISFFHNTISYRSNGEYEWDSLLQFIHSHYKPDSMKANWLIPFELFRFTQNPIGVHSIPLSDRFEKEDESIHHHSLFSHEWSDWCDDRICFTPLIDMKRL